jgi:hypothetical protein
MDMLKPNGQHKVRMQRILDHVQERYADIDEIAQKLVLTEMRELSKRWHNHEIHFISAMGTQCLYVTMRRPDYYGREVVKQVSPAYSEIRGVDSPQWMQDLDDIGEQIGNGCASLPFHFECKFRNGKKV